MNTRCVGWAYWKMLAYFRSIVCTRERATWNTQQQVRIASGLTGPRGEPALLPIRPLAGPHLLLPTQALRGTGPRRPEPSAAPAPYMVRPCSSSWCSGSKGPPRLDFLEQPQRAFPQPLPASATFPGCSPPCVSLSPRGSLLQPQTLTPKSAGLAHSPRQLVWET